MRYRNNKRATIITTSKWLRSIYIFTATATATATLLLHEHLLVVCRLIDGSPRGIAPRQINRLVYALQPKTPAHDQRTINTRLAEMKKPM